MEHPRGRASFDDDIPLGSGAKFGLNEIRELATISNNVTRIMQDIKDMREDFDGLRGQYVTQDQFEPVKKAVYGIITAIGLSLLTYGMNFVLHK